MLSTKRIGSCKKVMTLEEFFKSLDDFRASVAGNIIYSVVVYGVFSYFGAKLSKLIIRLISRRLDSKAVIWKYLKRTINIVFLSVFIFGVLSCFPEIAKFSPALVAGSSVAVAAIGLASQEAIANAISGIMISAFKPFAVGDRIRLVTAKISGFVQDINMRHTTVRTIENNVLLIPNTTINRDIIENFSQNDQKTCTFVEIELAHGSDLDTAKAIMLSAVLGHPMTVDQRTEAEIEAGEPQTRVLLAEFTQIGVRLRVGVWSASMSDSFRHCSDIREAMLDGFRAAGISPAHLNLPTV